MSLKSLSELTLAIVTRNAPAGIVGVFAASLRTLCDFSFSTESLRYFAEPPVSILLLSTSIDTAISRLSRRVLAIEAPVEASISGTEVLTMKSSSVPCLPTCSLNSDLKSTTSLSPRSRFNSPSTMSSSRPRSISNPRPMPSSEENILSMVGAVRSTNRLTSSALTPVSSIIMRSIGMSLPSSAAGSAICSP